MFEIFGALFGIAYLAGKSISEQVGTEAAEARRNKYSSIIEKMQNPELESNMRSSLEWKKGYYSAPYSEVKKRRWEMLREIPEKDLVYVFGNNWEEMFEKQLAYLPNTYTGTEGMLFDIWEMAFNIWLSKRHVISRNHTKQYYYNNIVRGMPQDRKQSKQAIFKMAKIIERNIQEKFPEASLSLNPINENVFPDKKNNLIWNFWLDCLDVPKRISPWGMIR